MKNNVNDLQKKIEQDFQRWLQSLPKHAFVGFLTLSENDDPRRAAYANALGQIEKACDALLARNGLNPEKFREQFYRDVVKRLAEDIIDKERLTLQTQDPPPGVYTGASPADSGDAPKPKKTRLRERRSGKERRKCVVFFEVERRQEGRRTGKERRADGAYSKK